jgi:hypothetical protein
MAFEMQPVDVVADLKEIINLLIATSYVHEPIEALMRNISPEDRDALIFDTFHDRLTRPGAVSFKIVETSTQYDLSLLGLTICSLTK